MNEETPLISVLLQGATALILLFLLITTPIALIVSSITPPETALSTPLIKSPTIGSILDWWAYAAFLSLFLLIIIWPTGLLLDPSRME